MAYQHEQIVTAQATLKVQFDRLSDKPQIMRSDAFRTLYQQIKVLPAEQRASFGMEVNLLKQEVQGWVDSLAVQSDALPPIDVTAPMDVNATRPGLLPTELGSQHPLMTELSRVLSIFSRMGFATVEARQIDDEYHMFSSLNFPEGHPARDDYDTFTTTEGFVAPAHASIMQNRLLRRFKDNLAKGEPISTVYTGRSFRNEDLDARHEHTFYQVEILYVDKDIHAGNLIATFKAFLEEYYEQDIEVRSQPFYFPFTEPSFELSLSCPFCKKAGCNICSYTGWIELLGMGMTHPKVLEMGGVDPTKYTGFAGGMGLERLVMMKYGIEDIRHFEAAKLEFLRQFS